MSQVHQCHDGICSSNKEVFNVRVKKEIWIKKDLQIESLLPEIYIYIAVFINICMVYIDVYSIYSGCPSPLKEIHSYWQLIHPQIQWEILIFHEEVRENHNWGLPLPGQIAITAIAKCKKKSLRLSWRLRKGNAIHAGDLQGKMFLKWSVTANCTANTDSVQSLQSQRWLGLLASTFLWQNLWEWAP